MDNPTQNNLHPAAQSLFEDVSQRLDRLAHRAPRNQRTPSVSITANNLPPDEADAFREIAGRRGVTQSKLAALLISAFVRAETKAVEGEVA